MLTNPERWRQMAGLEEAPLGTRRGKAITVVNPLVVREAESEAAIADEEERLP